MRNLISSVSMCRKCNKIYRNNEKFCISCGEEMQSYNVDHVTKLLNQAKECVPHLPELQSLPIIRTAIASSVPESIEVKKYVESDVDTSHIDSSFIIQNIAAFVLFYLAYKFDTFTFALGIIIYPVVVIYLMLQKSSKKKHYIHDSYLDGSTTGARTERQYNVDMKYNEGMFKWLCSIGLPFYNCLTKWISENTEKWNTTTDMIAQQKEQARRAQIALEQAKRAKRAAEDAKSNREYIDEEENARRDRMIAEECEKARRIRRDEYLRSIGRL